MHKSNMFRASFPLFCKLFNINIKDNDGNNMYPISAVCTDGFTYYLVSPSKNSDETRVVLSLTDENKNLIFLNIRNIPVSLFGGFSDVETINSDNSIAFIQNHRNKFELSLPDDEKPSSIACRGNKYYVTSSSGRVFKLSVTNENKTKPNFELVESLKRKKITEISGTYEYCLAVSEDGRVFGCGSNNGGMLGIGKETYKIDEFVEITSLNEHKIIHACTTFFSSLN